MPPLFQWVSYLIPVRYYANIIRGIFLKGSGPSVLWPDAAVLAAMGTVVLTLASLRFRKTLD
jgi:ABC-2 type transport system permease protein